MTLQWTVVALFLYFEIFVICLFMLPWIRPNLWAKVFRSRIARGLEAYSHVYVYAAAGILGLLFLDAIREVRKYSDANVNESSAFVHLAQADAVLHMRLFRAQRNLYISGFALFLWLVIRRMVQLISREAQLSASAEAAMRQAQGAARAAEQMAAGNEGDEKTAMVIEELKEKLRKAEMDRDAMKKQAEGLKREFDQLTERLQEKEGAAEKDD